MSTNSTYEQVTTTSALSFTLYQGVHYNVPLGSELLFRYLWVNSVGVSDPSPEVNVTLADPPSRCEKPVLINVTTSGGIWINMTQLTDTGGASIDNYTLEYSLENERSYSTYKSYSTF